MKRIFIASPLRGDYAKNLALAKFLCAEVTRAGYAAFAPHVFYTLFLDENSEEERKMGISAGCRWLRVADELWALARTFDECSEGMREEIKIAAVGGVKILYMPPILKDALAKWEASLAA